MRFQDFELEISVDDEHGYAVAIVHSPAGETRSAFELPFSSLELEKYILELQNALLRSGGPQRRHLSQAEQTVQDFGCMLFDALFPGEIKNRYDVSRQMAASKGDGLRVKLRIQPSELAALPWEFLFDPRRQEYICLSRNTPVVRYLNLPRPVRPLAIKPPLRILGMVASPSDQEPLDVTVEKERLRRALQGLEAQGLVKLDWLEGQSWDALQKALYQPQYHIFHFIGHGYFDEAEAEGMVVFTNAQGRSDHFSATKLARLLADHTSLRLAVLNSCEGAKAGEYDIFSSTAATLVRRGLPAVIAMQYDITDDAAIKLAESFYHAVGSGLPVDAALAEARKSISFGVKNSLEWGTPVLFMRANDGKLFDIEPVSTTAAAVITAAVQPETSQPISPASPQAAFASPDVEPTPSGGTDGGRPWLKIGLALLTVVIVLALGYGIYSMSTGESDPPPTDSTEQRGESTATKPVDTRAPTQVAASTGTVHEFGGIPFVYVAAGEFEMGSERGEDDERPIHAVYLDSYWIMQTEVTNAQYAKCVSAGVCKEEGSDRLDMRDYADHPVTGVRWHDAVAYAQWLSAETGESMRLPTEAEWEKAARGDDLRSYPWGEAPPGDSRLNYHNNVKDTMPVGSYPEGAGPFGALDMAGNVLEWVADSYDSNYYATSPTHNPQGPTNGVERVMRGGSWLEGPYDARAPRRNHYNPSSIDIDLGFRLAFFGSDSPETAGDSGLATPEPMATTSLTMTRTATTTKSSEVLAAPPTPTPTLTPTFAPMAPSIFDRSVPDILDGESFTLMGQAQPGAALEILANEALLGAAIADAEGFWTFDVTLDEPDDYLLSVRAIYSDTEIASADEPMLVIVPAPTPTIIRTPIATWPTEGGVEACHLRLGEKVTVRENARLWDSPDVRGATHVADLPEGSQVEIVGGPEWGRIREDIVYSAWWYKTTNGNDNGWIWDARLEGCTHPDEYQ